MKKASQPASAATPCLICGYDLTGLPAETVCPECAVPTGPSVRRNLFELTGVDQGKRVLRGLQLARDAAWAGLIAAAVALADMWADQRVLSLFAVGIPIAALAFAFGWLRATRLPRAPAPPQGLLGPTKWARLSIAAVPILFVVMMVLARGPTSIAPPPVRSILLFLLPFAILLAAVARLVLTSEWMGRMSEHLGDDRTPKQVRRRVRLAPILVVLFILLLAGAALLRDFAAAGSITAYVAIAASVAVAAAGLATYAWLYIGLIHTCHRTVRAALAAASVETDEPVTLQPTYRAGH